MKKKSLRIILSLAICVMVMTMFSVTAFAAGDVSGASEVSGADRRKQRGFPCD